MHSSFANVRGSRDRKRVMLRFAEEVPETDPINATDAIERLNRRNHPTAFELREQRIREAGGRGETRKSELLAGTERAEFQAYRIDREWVLRSVFDGILSSHEHRQMLAWP